MERVQRRILADVAEHGWHVIKVMEDESGPAFGYSIGLQRSLSHPEIVVFGLPLDTMHHLINAVVEQICTGVRFEVGARSSDLLEGFACVFREFPRAHYGRHLGQALWFYGGPSFSAVQLVWPDRDGRYPWDPRVPESFRRLQPVLSESTVPA